MSLLTVIGDRDDDHLHPKYLNRAANLRVEARHNPETKKIAKTKEGAAGEEEEFDCEALLAKLRSAPNSLTDAENEFVRMIIETPTQRGGGGGGGGGQTTKTRKYQRRLNKTEKKKTKKTQQHRLKKTRDPPK